VEVDVEAVRAIVAAAQDHDRVSPLSEQALLRLRHRHAPIELVELSDRGDPLGYLQLDPTATGIATAEMVVHPAHRRRGHGSRLVERTLEAVPDGHLAVWAHGDLPAAAGLAARLGFERRRILRRMRRALTDLPPLPEPPSGVRIRTFRPGSDDEAWLAVNRRAFAEHPEQGRLTIDDLHERFEEPWFDPAGFFLAERKADDGTTRLAGFHWTKIHPATAVDEAAGEVYVIGVDPGEQGTGLGRALTLTGLHHLAGKGLRSVILYADETNGSAVSMYERLGFDTAATDVLYAR
jgi:mycothiol synthase